MGGETGGVCVYAGCCEVCLMLLLARCCWRNEDDGDMLDRVAWNAACLCGRDVETNVSVVVRLLQQRVAFQGAPNIGTLAVAPSNHQPKVDPCPIEPSRAVLSDNLVEWPRWPRET